jgi:hypothetical protein
MLSVVGYSDPEDEVRDKYGWFEQGPSSSNGRGESAPRKLAVKPNWRWQYENGPCREAGGRCRSIPLERGHVY